MADPTVAAAMTAARALLSPGDPATLAAADAHLRAVNDGPDGWRIARDLLAAPAETPGDVLAPRVRIMGAAMLRAKAHADGFAMTPPEAASMTAELLAMLGTPEGSGELGPHLAQISAAVATAGGADTLFSLVQKATAIAAPDSNGGWSNTPDPNATPPCGPNAHAAVALMSACAEEALHRSKSHPHDVTEAMQEALDDVTWTLQAVVCDGNVPDQARADAFTALRLWIPAGVTASELATDRSRLFDAVVEFAVGGAMRLGDPAVKLAAAEVLEELCAASDPLPGRTAAVDSVLKRLESEVDACEAFANSRLGWNLGDDPGDDRELERVRAHVWSVATTCGALATSEPGAFATHGHGKCVRFLTQVAGRADARTASSALAALRSPPPRGLCAHLRSPSQLNAVFDALCLRLATRAAGAGWRAFVSESADRLAVERSIGGGYDQNRSDAPGPTSFDDDEELAAVPDVEAAVGSLHAAMGTGVFMQTVFDRLSKASGDPVNVAAELAMLADSGYPLSPDAPEDPRCVDIANALVGLPVCDLAPVKSLVARTFRGPFKRLLTSDPDSFSRATRYLLRASVADAPDESVACARACVRTIGTLIEDVCVGGHDVVRSHRAGIDAVLGETRALTSRDRGAFISAVCQFYLAAKDPGAIDELAAHRIAHLTSDQRAAAGGGGGANEAAYAAESAGEIRVLRDWCESGAASVARRETIDSIWRASWRFMELAVDRGYGGVSRECCELWRTLPLASASVNDDDVATALSLVDQTLRRLSTKRFDADAFASVVDTLSAFLEENVRVDEATALLSTAIELLWREGEKLPEASRMHGKDDRLSHSPDAAAAAFKAAAVVATKSRTSTSPCSATDACLRQASMLCRGQSVEPTTSALRLIEHVWSRAPWSNDAEHSESSLFGSLGAATVAGVAAAAAECANPALLEPIALALWSASARCAEEGGTEASAWLGGVMVGALARGDGLLGKAVESSAMRAGAVTTSHVDAFVYACAMRRPQHPARRVAELVDAFGRACRGHGPASVLEEYR